jgi:hypothetical protein
MEITSQERLNLKKLISETECEDNTPNIRKLKHSTFIRDDIRTLEALKKREPELYENSPEKFLELAQEKCNFLYNNYMDIFAKVLKDEIDLDIMTRLLTVLKLIEDGNVDQHEGSVLVGRILKELYLDAAVKRADNIDKQYESEKTVPENGKDISWRQFKIEGTRGSP